jgi:xanthine/uracil/vitamin C permease (AzgA family)
MTLNANKLFLATAVVFAFLWIICSALVALIPGPMLTMTGYMVHSELETFSWSLTGAGFAGGLVLWALVPGITVWLIAAAYNRLAR